MSGGRSPFDETEVQAIIERVKARLGTAAGSARPGAALRAAEELAEISPPLGDGMFPDIPAAVDAATAAFRAYQTMGLGRRFQVITAIRQAMEEDAERLAQLAHQETGLGRPEDKVKKNLLVTRHTPGPEDLEPQVVTGDAGMMVTEYAPFGVVAAITPTTNPTSTIINNTISILSAGNAAVFNVHPNAKKVSAENIRLLNRAILAGGGPPNLVTAIPSPTIDSAKQLMHHPGVPVLLVTGGPGVVAEAMRTTKRVVAAGPGNPPAVVDETANLDQAAADIVAGASFDNNIVCTDEKTTIVLESVADRLLGAFARQPTYLLKEHELRRLERVIFKELGPPNKPGVINPAWIGKNAAAILAEIGVGAGPELRLLVAEVPNQHSLVWTEQMMPVMPVTRVRTIDAAIELAVRSEHGFRHTASIHSTNVEHITRMAKAMNCSIFVANGSNYAGLGEGGEGFTSYSIASPTGDGLTRARTFCRPRRVTVVGSLRIV